MSMKYKESFKLSEPENLSLSIFNCGIQSCESSYTWGPGVRDHYLIHLIRSGKGQFSIDNKSHTLTIGCLFFAKPGQLIDYTADDERPWEYSWVGFNGAYASRLASFLPFNDNKPYFRLHEKDFDTAKAFLDNIYCARGSEIYKETEMTGHLYLFLSFLIQRNQKINKPPATTGAEYVQNTIRYIQFNYSQDINVDDISRAIGVSRSHLYRIFMGTVGQSLVDYLTNFRISEACTLLETSSLSISEIAYSVGIFDQFYFSRVFKKVMGMPPTFYQKIKQDEKKRAMTKNDKRSNHYNGVR